MKNWLNRRKFIKRIIFTLLGIELFYVLFNLLGKKKAKNNVELFIAGEVHSFQNGSIYPFSSGRFFLSKFDDGGLLAISIKCTHLGCMVQPDSGDEGYTCPCHSSSFNKYGEVKSPPATRALDIFPIIIENGQVKVDVGNPVKRKNFRKSQLTYA